MKRTAGTGGVYQRGDTWWVRYSYRGRKHRESSHSTQRGDAVKLLKRRLAEMGTGRLIGPDADKTTFEDIVTMLLDDYKLNGLRSVKRVETALVHLREFFAFARVPDVTSDRIAAYIRLRQEAKAAPATIAYELACLKRAFSLALRAGKAAQRPYIPSVKVDNARKGFFEPADFANVEAHLPRALRPYMRFLYLTGWRAGEARGLTWADVNFETGVARLEPGTTKNREGREFPFAALQPLADLLQQQRDETRELERKKGRIIAHVFHRNGKPIKSYVRAWKAACKAAGQEGRLVHDLRRSAVRNLERAGCLPLSRDEPDRAQDGSRVSPLRDHVAGRSLRRRCEARGAPRWRSRLAERYSVLEGHSSGTIGGIISGRPSPDELSKWFQ